MAIATVELTFAEETLALAAEEGFEKKELTALKRVLAKKSDADILEAVRRLSNSSGALEATDFIGTLYSMTLTQLLKLELTLKTIDGWD